MLNFVSASCISLPGFNFISWLATFVLLIVSFALFSGLAYGMTPTAWDLTLLPFHAIFSFATRIGIYLLLGSSWSWSGLGGKVTSGIVLGLVLSGCKQFKSSIMSNFFWLTILVHSVWTFEISLRGFLFVVKFLSICWARWYVLLCCKVIDFLWDVLLWSRLEVWPLILVITLCNSFYPLGKLFTLWLNPHLWPWSLFFRFVFAG